MRDPDSRARLGIRSRLYLTADFTSQALEGRDLEKLMGMATWLCLSLAAGPLQDSKHDSARLNSRLGVIQQAPDWQLMDQNGKEVRARDFAGQVLLVSFIFTTCNGSCPATTHRMEKVQAGLKARGLLKQRKVHLLSFSLDPERDTSARLHRYMEMYDADASSWSFLTGPRDRVHPILASWHMWARPAENGQLDHPSRIFLVDAQQRVREIYNLSFLRPEWVVEDIELLLHESARREK